MNQVMSGVASATETIAASQRFIAMVRSGKMPGFFPISGDLGLLAETWRGLGRARVEALSGLAEEAIAHRFDLLGSGLTDLGRTIDWHRDFKSGHRWKPLPIAQVQTVSGVPGSDIKVPWELSRFYHAPVLGIARLIHGDERFAREYIAQVDDWISSNPVAHGANWKCAMEAAIRSANWLVALPYFAGSPALDDRFLARLGDSLREHGRFIRDNLEGTVHLRSNHYLADLQGLLYLGILCPCFPEADSWVAFACAELEKEMDWEVYPDGTDFEASIPYHRLCLELILGPALLVRANGRTLSTAFWERLHGMFRVIRDLSDQGGHIPMIGDNDSGRLHTLARRPDDDLRYLLPIGAVVFSDPELCIAGVPFSEEALLLLGPSGLSGYSQMVPNPSCRESVAYPDSGWYVLRQETEALLEELTISCGPNGQRFRDPPEGHPLWNGGHAHNDKLSIVYSVAGIPVLVDPGTACYTSDPVERNRSRSTRSHNTVQIGLLEQQTLRDDYLFNIHDQRARPAAITWRPGAGDLRFEGEHHGFVSDAGAIHRRSIQSRQGGGYIITDRLLPEGKQADRLQVTWHFHAGEGQRVAAVGKRCWQIGELAMLVFPEWLPGEAEILADRISPAYGVQRPSSTLRVTVSVKPPFTLSWNLVPARLCAGAVPSCRSVDLGADRVTPSSSLGIWEQPSQTCTSASLEEMLEALEAGVVTLNEDSARRGHCRALRVQNGQPPSVIYSRLDYWNAKAKAGGSIGHTSHVIEGFHQAGSAVTVVAGIVPPMIDPKLFSIIQVKEPHQPWPVQHYEHQFFAAGEAYAKSFRDIVVQSNASFIYERIVIGNPVAALTAKHLGIPFVLEYNGSEIWVLRHWAKTPLHHEDMFLRIESAILRSADLIVVVSDPLRQELIQRGIEDGRILVNPNAVDPDRFDADGHVRDRSILRAEYGFADGDIVLGFIGTFGAWHGIPVLAKALDRILAIDARIKLLLIGDGNLRGVMEEAIRRGGHGKRAIITGIVPQDRAPAYLSACDIFLSPHQTPPDDERPFFGSPTKIFEYLAMGKPTIASNLGQIGEIMRPALEPAEIAKADPLNCSAVGILTKPGDIDQLVVAIAELVSRPQLCASIGSVSRAHVLANHTWKIHIHRIIERLMSQCSLTDQANFIDSVPSGSSKLAEPPSSPPVVEPIPIPAFDGWNLMEAFRRDSAIESKATTFSYMIESSPFTVPMAGAYSLAIRLEFLEEGAITFGILDHASGGWVANVNIMGKAAVSQSCIAALAPSASYRLVIANCRNKPAVTRIKVHGIEVVPVPVQAPKILADQSRRDEAMKDEVRRQWNTDHCGGDRGGPEVPGSLAWFLNIERDRYENYAPWMKKAIGFDRYGGKRLLEIGGGLGTDHAQFAKAGAITTDYDLAEGHLNMAKRNFSLRGLKGEFILGDAEHLPFPDASFDVVYSFGVIHHTPGTDRVVRHIHRVLKPGGEAIIMVYARHSWNYWYRDFYKLYLRQGMYKTMTMAELLSANTEHSPNGARPLVKVYSARECRRLFDDFSEVSVEKYQLTAPEIPSIMLKVLPLSAWGRLMGWNLLIRAVK